MGVATGAELRKLDLAKLVRDFGRSGVWFYGIARGVDERVVTPDQPRKSLGREITLQHDTDDICEILDSLRALSDEVWALLEEENYPQLLFAFICVSVMIVCAIYFCGRILSVMPLIIRDES